MSGPAQLAAYESDGLTAFHARPLAVVIPESQEEVVKVVRFCHAEKLPFVARGSGTSLSGGSLPFAGGIVITLNRLNRILRLDSELVLNTTNANAVSTTLLALVRKAHHLGSAVIAPGIDAVERAHILIRMGIDYGAGDGLGRAQREPEFDFDKPIW